MPSTLAPTSHRSLSLGGFLLASAAALAAISLARKHTNFSFRNRVVVITGGSRGLGLVMARQLAREGAKVVLLARDEGELLRAKRQIAAAGGSALTISCDVRDGSQAEAAIERVARYFGRLDVLINNAGVIQVGPLDNMSLHDFRNAMDTHFYGPLVLTLAARRHLRRSPGGGRVVNIASIGGKVAVPHLLPYTASKFALVGLSDGLRAELSKENILVTTVCPGLMRTGSPRNALFKGHHRDEHAWFSIGDSLPGLSMSAERAARKILAAARQGSGRLVLGLPAKTAVIASELLPGTAAQLSKLGNKLLPKSNPAPRGYRARRGAESESFLAPSVLTHFSDTAARQNNEVAAH